MKLTPKVTIYCLGLLIVTSAFCISPADGTDLSIKSPGTLTPYSADLNKTVTAKQLRDDILKWKEAWKQKEITVFAWRQGMSGTGRYTFVDHNNPGLIVLQADISESEINKFNAVAATSEFILIRGSVKEIKRSLSLTNCSIAGGVNDLPVAQKLSPFEIKTTDAVFPQDVVIAANAWQHIEVTIKDKCMVPMAGNVISFIDATIKDNRNSRYNIVRAVLKQPIKNGKPFNAIKTVRGRVNNLDEQSKELSLYNCEILP